MHCWPFVLIFAVAAGSLAGIVFADEADPGRESHWAFENFATVSIPSVLDSGRIRTPIDAFIAARLRESRLQFSPDADRTTLIRRLSLDLLGIPPTIAEVDAFLSDHRPGAYERLVDRMLASPRFGERWARHWLDVAGYADTIGFDMNANAIILSEGKWRYRDYVIDSLNGDKPYDVFIRQQLAGDEAVDWRNAKTYTPEIVENLVATGYLRTAQDFTHERISNIPSNHYAVIHDTLEIVGTSLFAVTLKCARCHDHKYDPFPQQDYYRLMACLTPAYNSKNWKAVIPYMDGIADRSLPAVSAADAEKINQHNATVDKKLAEIKVKMKEFKNEELSESEESPLDDLKAQEMAFQAIRRKLPRIQALWDVGPAPATYLHIRGNFERPGDEVQPGYLSVLEPASSNGRDTDRTNKAQTTGRRSALADWVTRKETPASALLSRVMINRLWMHLFGEGLVQSAGNLGTQGTPPSHPQLLEWLSRDFQHNGWSIKRVVRQIVTSTTWRQASRRSDLNSAKRAESIDPGNKLLWRMRMRRVDAEVIRDSLLALGGNLDEQFGGPAVNTHTSLDGRVVEEKSGQYRRSIYLLVRRAYNPSLLTVFDQPVIGTTCPQRQPSAVVSQSLMMLNDGFLAGQSERFARRVETHADDAWPAQVETVFRMALARRPNPRERTWCVAHLKRQSRLFKNDTRHAALTDLCHAILNTSEFLYSE